MVVLKMLKQKDMFSSILKNTKNKYLHDDYISFLKNKVESVT